MRRAGTEPDRFHGGRVVPKEQTGWLPKGSAVCVTDGVRNESSVC